MADKSEDRDMDLVEVHRAWGPVEAEVIKSLLASHGISCIMRGQAPQSIFPYSVDGMGEIKILVQQKDHKQAKELIQTKKSE